MTNALTITDIVYDEAGLPDADNDANTAADANVASLSTALSSQISALSLSGQYYTGANSVTQYAELTNFVSSTDSPVTNYLLARDSSGDGFSTTGTGVATGLYVGGDEIFLYGTSDPNVVVGRIGNLTAGVDTGKIAMIIALNETKDGAGHVTATDLSVTMFAPLTHSDGSHVDDADVLSMQNGSIFLYSTYDNTAIVEFPNFVGVPSGDDEYALIKPGNNTLGADLLVTGFAGAAEGSVNVSTTGLGANAQTVANGSSLRIDLVNVTDADYNFQLGSPVGAHDISTLHYENHVEVIAAGFELTQNNPNGKLASLTVSAYQVSGDSKGSAFATNAFTDGTLVHIATSNVIIRDDSGHDITATFGGAITQSLADGKSIQITGLAATEHVDFTADSQFDRFIVFNNMTSATDKTTFDIGDIHVSTMTGGVNHDVADLSPHLKFEDGGPSVSPTNVTLPTVTVDEDTLGAAGKQTGDFSGLFDVNYGPDGPAAASALAYALAVSSSGANSTLVDTATGFGVFLYKDGSDVVGRVGTSLTVASSTGDIDFRISVASNGTVTFEQDHAVKHSDPNAADETASMSLASLVTLTATAHDGDGDSATSNAVNIGTAFAIKDDEPHALGAGSNLIVGNTTNATINSTTPYVNTGSFANTVNAGNDGLLSFTILSYDPGSGLTGGADSSGAFTWVYDGNTHSIIESYTDPATHVPSPLFALTLNSTGGVYDGAYTVTMQGTLPYGHIDLDANNIKAGGPTGSIDVGTLNDGGDFVRLSGMYNTTFNSGSGQLSGTTGAVNASNGNVGVNNGNLDSGELLGFQLFSSGGTLIPFYGLDMGTKTASSSSYEVYGLFDSDHKIHDLGHANSPLSKGGVIHYAGTDLLDEIFVKETNGNAVKIGLSGVHLLTAPDDVGFHFAAQLTDGDGDHVFSPFNVFIDGNNDGTVDPNMNGLFVA